MVNVIICNFEKETIMDCKVNHLNGEANERSNKVDSLNSDRFSAMANEGQISSKTNLSKPSDDAIWDAKDWVDNGSQL